MSCSRIQHSASGESKTSGSLIQSLTPQLSHRAELSVYYGINDQLQTAQG